MKDQATETKPAVVPARAKQAGEVRARWPWVKSEVWTERMLTALEEGVEGGKWFSLSDKVYDPRTLRISFGEVKSNSGAPGEDHQTIQMFEDHLDENLSRLLEELKGERYRPRAIQRVYIPKPGSREKRPLGDTDGQGPGGAGGDQDGDGADFRAGLPRGKLRFPAGS